MAATCSICKRSDVDSINEQLRTNVPVSKIVAQRTNLSARSINRHKQGCLKAVFEGIVEQKRAGLLSDVDKVREEIEQVKTDFPDNPNVRIGIIGKMIDVIEKEAKLTGAFIKDGENPHNIKDVAWTILEQYQTAKEFATIYDESKGRWGKPMPDNLLDSYLNTYGTQYHYGAEELRREVEAGMDGTVVG